MAETVKKSANPFVPSASTVRRTASHNFQATVISTGPKVNTSRRGHRCFIWGKDNHLRNNCKFRNAKWRSCGKVGLITVVCRSRKAKCNANNISESSIVQDSSTSNVFMSAFVSDSTSPIYVDLKMRR